MAIAALLLWMCTAAVGTYLLAISVRAANVAGGPAEPVPVPAERSAAAAANLAGGGQGASTVSPAPARPASPHEHFDPPSLQRAKEDPLPGLKALAEFAHPALAIIGLSFWICYVISRDQIFAAIGFGVLLGAIFAGMSWAITNARSAKRSAAAGAAGEPRARPLAVPPRVLALHAAGAALTLLFAALIAARL